MARHLKIPKHFKLKEKTSIVALMITFVLLVTTIMAVENYYTVFYGTDHGYMMNRQGNQAQDVEDMGEVNEDESINTLAQATSEIYLDPSSGIDTNTGLTSDTAIKTFDKAKALSSSGGTIYLCNTLTLSTNDETIDGEDKNLTLKRYGSSFTGAMIEATATGINIKNLTMDGGAVWTGDLDETLGRGTTNSGIQAKNSVVYIRGGDTTLTNCVLQNNDSTSRASGAKVYNRSTFKMIGGKVLSNTSGISGGGIGYEDGAQSGGNIELYGVTIGSKNAGNQARDGGGGIFLYQSSGSGPLNKVVIEDTDINYNKAKDGGGVYVHGKGDFTMTGGSISSNFSNENGGGVYVNTSGTLTMTGGNISSNTGFTNGGGIYSSGTTTLKGVIVGGQDAGNTTHSYGGGIHVYGGVTTVTDDTVISYNKAPVSGVYVNTSGTFTMTGGNISSNTNGGVCSYGKITLKGVTVGGKDAGNTGPSYGGGVSVYGGTTTVIDDTNITYNSASERGGGVYVYKGTFTMTGGSISSNSSNRNGGGVYVLENGTFIMTGGNISSNTSTTYGGGIYSVGTTILNGVTVGEKDTGNTVTGSSSYGGGVYVGGGTTTFTDGTSITFNESKTRGGGIYVEVGTCELTSSDVDNAANISNNKSSYGGGIYADSNGTFTMTRGSISSNESTSYGGGLYSQGTTELHGVTVGGQGTGNTANGSYGGGVYVGGGTTTVTDDTNITYNNAQNGGGAYVSADSAFKMTGGNILSNTAERYGGGIYSLGTAELHGVTVGDQDAGNTANDGGGLYTGRGTATLSDGTSINYNTTSGFGGGVYVNSGTFKMTGGNISSNTAKSYGGGIYSGGTTELHGVTVGGQGGGNVSNAFASRGGGIYVAGGAATIADGTTISYNTSILGTEIFINSTSTVNMDNMQALSKDKLNSCIEVYMGTINWSNMVKIDGQVKVGASEAKSIVTSALTDDSYINFSVAEIVVTNSWTVAKSDGTYAMTEADANKFSVQSDVTHRLVKLNLGTTSAEVKIGLPLRYTITIPESISGANEVMSGDFDVNLSYTTMLSNEKIKMDVIVPQGGIIMKQKIGDSYDSTKYLKVGFGLSTDNIVEYPTSGTYEVLRMTREEYDNDVFNKKVYWKLNKPSENTVVDFGDYEVPDGVTFSFSVVTT